mmetsp:Transcript_5111/g.9952  ORF Transcript_5111/g.9952 Transcript_5111/m.9952 type:complete len:115 (+) Transcript_5111:1-345(+)
MMSTSAHTQVGSCMLSVGALFAFIGFSIFDNGLLALGNIYLVSGCFIMLGYPRTKGLLLKYSNLKFTLFLVAGFTIVIAGWPRIGILVELFGLYHLMKTFLYMPIQIARSYLGI